MREKLLKFEEWFMITIILFSFWCIFAGKYFALDATEFLNIQTEQVIEFGSKLGFTLGLSACLIYGSLCLMITRWHSTTAFWFLVVLCAPILCAFPVILMWSASASFVVTWVALFASLMNALRLLFSNEEFIFKVTGKVNAT